MVNLRLLVCCMDLVSICISADAGAKYELPPFVLSAPTNLVRDDMQLGFQAGSSTAAELMSH